MYILLSKLYTLDNVFILYTSSFQHEASPLIIKVENSTAPQR